MGNDFVLSAIRRKSRTVCPTPSWRAHAILSSRLWIRPSLRRHRAQPRGVMAFAGAPPRKIWARCMWHQRNAAALEYRVDSRRLRLR